MGPKSLLFTLQLPCPAGLATVAGNLVGSAMRVWLWFGRACGEAASLQGRACPSDWLWMTLCCAAVQPRDNSCRCKPRASHGSSLTHCIAGTTVALSGSGYGRHEPLPMLAARTGDQGTRAGCFLDSTFACKLVPCSPVRAASMGSGSCRPYPLADEARKWPCNARSSKSGNRSRVAQPGLTHKSDTKCAAAQPNSWRHGMLQALRRLAEMPDALGCVFFPELVCMRWWPASSSFETMMDKH